MAVPALAAGPDISVNSTGWWRGDVSNFNSSVTPIQSALDNAITGEYIQVVEAGTYPESLTMKVNGTLDLGGATLDGSATPGSDGILINNLNDVIIKNGVISGFYQTVHTTGTTNRITFDHLTILNSHAYGIYIQSNFDGLTITNVDIENPTIDGIVQTIWAGGNNILVKDTAVNGSGDYGIWLGGIYPSGYPLTNVVLDNVTVKASHSDGIYVNLIPTGSGNVTVKNSHISDNHLNGIHILANGTVVVQNNIIQGNGFDNGDNVYYGLNLYGYISPALTFSGNTITDNRNGVLTIYIDNIVVDNTQDIKNNGGYEFSFQYGNNITLKDRVIDNSARGFAVGVLANNINNMTVKNITISGATYTGIYTQNLCNDLVIDNVAMVGSGYAGIYLESSGINTRLTGIMVDRSTNYGILKYYWTTAQNMLLKDVFVNNTQIHDGVNLHPYAQFSNVTLDNVTSINSGGSGIHVFMDGADSGGLTIRNSNSSYNLGHGLDVHAKGPVTISDNVMKWNGFGNADGVYYGLSLDGVGNMAVTLSNNAITDNRNGVYLSNVNGLTMGASEDVRNNDGYVFRFAATDHMTISDRALDAYASDFAIAVYATDSNNLTLTNLSINYSRANSIQTGGTCDNLVIDHVRATNSRSSGIYTGSNSNGLAITNVVIDGSTNYGIMKYTLSNWQNALVKDVYINNTHIYEGIYLHTSATIANVTLDNVTAINSGGNGLYVYMGTPGSGNLTVKNSNMSYNAACGMNIIGNGPITLKDNVMMGNGFAAGDNSYYGLSLIGVNSPVLTMSDNRITDNRNGIYLESVGGLTLDESAYAGDNNGYQIRLVNTDHIIVPDRSFDGYVKDYAIGVYPTNSNNLTLYNLSMNYSRGSSIYLDGTCNDLLIDHVRIINARDNGMYFYSWDNGITIKDTVIDGSTNYGIVRYPWLAWENVLLKDVFINNSHNGDGINFNSGYAMVNMTLDNVTAINSGARGMFLNTGVAGSDVLTVKNSNASYNSQSGIEFSSTGSVTLKDNVMMGNGFTAGDNTYYGMSFTGVNSPVLTMSDNRITDNRNGIYLANVNDLTLDESAYTGDNNGYQIRVINTDHIIVSDRTFDGYVKDYAIGVYSTNSNNLTLYNLSMNYSRGSSIYLDGTCNDLLIDHVRIINARDNGMYFYSWDNGITIKDTVIDGSTNYGIIRYPWVGWQNVLLKDVLVDHTHGNDGINFNTGYAIANMTLDNVTAINSAGRGMFLNTGAAGSGNLTVKNSNASYNGANGIELNSMGSVTLTDNVIMGNSFAGGDNYFYGLFINGVNSPVLTMSDNRITDNRNGIYLSGLNNWTLDATENASNNHGYPIRLVTTDNITIPDRAFDGYANEIISAVYATNSNNLTLYNLSINYSHGNSIQTEGTCDNLVIDHVRIINAQGNGIYFISWGNGITVSNVLIDGSTSYGIIRYPWLGWQNVLLKDVLINNTHNGDGINFGSGYPIANMTLDNVTAINSGGRGIYLYMGTAGSGNLTVKNSNVSDNGQNGIEAYVNDTVTLTDNVMNDNGKYGDYYGLWLYGINSPTIVFRNNKIVNNTEGVYINGIDGNYNDSRFGGKTYDLNLASTNMTAYNTSFNRTKLQLDGESSVTVYWYLDLLTTLSGNPVKADYTIYNLSGQMAQKGTTANNGRANGLLLREYWKNSTLEADDSPFAIATISTGNGMNNTTLDMSSSSLLNIKLLAYPSFRFDHSAYSIPENGGNIKVTVIRDGYLDQPSTVSYATSDGTATSGLDYTTVTGTLNFGAGESSKSFNVSVQCDNLYIPGKTINLTLGSPTDAKLGTPNASTITIIETEKPGALQFSQSSYYALENFGYVTITVNRTGGSDLPITVDYTTVDGTAKDGKNYTATNGTLKFDVGETSKTFDVQFIQDFEPGADSSLTLQLSNATNGSTITRGIATLTIQETDNGNQLCASMVVFPLLAGGLFLVGRRRGKIIK